MSTLTTEPKPLNFADDPIMVVGQTGAEGEDNLTLSLTLEDVSGAEPAFQAKLKSPYDANGETAINISDLFDLAVPLPAQTLTGGVTHHTAAFSTYRLQHADRYGWPPTESATVGNSAEFMVVRGASRYLYGFGTAAEIAATNWYLMHAYSLNDFRSKRRVKKVVSLDQPEPIYLFNNTDASLTVNYSAQKIDASGAAGEVENGTFVLPNKGLYNAFLSPSQLGEMDDVVAYTLSLTHGTKTEVIEYILDKSPNDYALFMLYENGCGGMETVRMAGRHRVNAQASGQVANSTLWSGFSHSEGQQRTINFRGGEDLELNTGYYPADYIRHLGNMLFSDCWLWDATDKKLYCYRITSRQLKTSDDNEMLHNLTVSLTPATPQRTLNNFMV